MAPVQQNIPDFDVNKKYISGPVNAARLEGEINGTKKVVYLFMDYHVDLFNQTECTNIFKQDIDEYLAKTFYGLNKSNKMYDFFLEIRPSEELYKKSNSADNISRYKYIYIQEVLKLFKKIFKYDEEKNKVDIPDIFQNVRLHYLDIRDYLYVHVMTLVNELNMLSHQLIHHSSGYVLQSIIEKLKSLKEKTQSISDIIKKTENYPDNSTKIIKQKNFDTQDIIATQQFVYKMKYRYNHNNIKKILNQLLDKYITELDIYIQNLETAINDFTKYNQDIAKTNGVLIRDDRYADPYNYGPSFYDINIVVKLVTDKLYYLYDQIVFLFAKITDIYLLRRLLDKDYVTNSIIYSGEFHSAHYIYLLLKYFDFRITHIVFHADKSLKDLNTNIPKSNLREIGKFIYKDVLDQCVDITDFPENFE